MRGIVGWIAGAAWVAAAGCGGSPPDLQIPVDQDGDGFLPGEDCDDGNRSVFPDAPEACNAVDDDCDGAVDEGLPTTAWYPDGDGDGWGRDTPILQACAQPVGFTDRPGDCDDRDPRFHPGADEPCTEAVDYNCDNSIQFADSDGDGRPACADCNDTDPDAWPGADERCNGADDDCDGTIDEDPVDPSPFYADEDLDGYGDDEAPEVYACEAPDRTSALGGDCDDADAAFHPGAPEDCADPSDYNCDGSVLFADADGDAAPACLDCDDADGSAFPGAPETCDGVDDDCDTVVDDDPVDPGRWFRDVDGDQFGDPGQAVDACEAPDGHVAAGTDCDDADPTVFPGGVERCDDADRDEDCDTFADDADADADPAGMVPWYADLDGDGYGDDAAAPVLGCDPRPDAAPVAGDCDDAVATTNPAADERCDGAGGDEDCDGLVDDADAPVDPATWYGDDDGDGHGDPGRTALACAAPDDFVAAGDDCDDTDGLVFPGAAERCDGVDGDCDTTVDEDAVDAVAFFADADSDGYGVPGATVTACVAPPGWSAVDTDCDDLRPDVNPGAPEVCDAADADEDCDTLADDADGDVTGTVPFHRDLDADGFGDPTAATAPACEPPAGHVADATDCDDADASVNPAATEIVGDGEDEDCDGGELCLSDADDDGFLPASPGAVASADLDCDDPFEAPAGAPGGDCNDAAASAYPGATEVCNGIDDDCLGDVDEGLDQTFYADVDADGYGNAAATTVACAAPAGYVADATDCDDAQPTVNPGYPEVCADGLDNDCAVGGDCVFDGDVRTITHDVRLSGEVASDTLGRALAVGDFDGDGHDDLLAGMSGADVPASSAGAALLWYGPLTSGLASSADLRLNGDASAQYTGYDVSSADLDGDGLDELLIGAYGTAPSSTGAVHVVYGGTTALGTTTAAGLALTDGATFTGGATLDYFGYSVSGGDVDADGYDDLLVGAYLQDGAASSAGAAYLFYGSATPFSGTRAAATADVTIRGVASSDFLGYALTVAGDVNGDGAGELLIGAYGHDAGGSSRGAAYLVFGDPVRLSGTFSAATVADVTVTGVVDLDYLGRGLAGVGDLDGDGYGDWAVGSDGYDGPSASSAGLAHVLRGGSAPTAAPVATITGVRASDYLGEEIVSPGDLDGDGYDELLVGAYGVDGVINTAGAAYLFHGPVTGVMSASAADAVFLGPELGDDAHFGRRFANRPADLTGDGELDVIVGAYYDDVDRTSLFDGGSIYVWSASDMP